MAKEKKPRLGTGLSALFDNEPEIEEQKDITMLPLRRIENNAAQPRKAFDPEAIEELAESIRTYGLIQPITVRPLDGGFYQIIAGERRWRAARQAGLTEVPVRILEADDKAAMEMALVENLQRQDLNPVEEAEGYKTLMEEYGLTQQEVSERVGKSRPAVANALRLLDLVPSVLSLLEDGSITAGHARALRSLPGTLQDKAAGIIIAKEYSVRQAEKLAADLLKEPKPEKEKPAVDYVKAAEKDLSDCLGRGVHLTKGNKGSIRLDYYSADDREALMEALKSMRKTWQKTEE